MSARKSLYDASHRFVAFALALCSDLIDDLTIFCKETEGHLHGHPCEALVNRITVIVLNWNGERLLGVCLEALLRQTYGNYEVILVDNGSKDSSVQLARENFPEVRLVQLAENKGFTGGNAAGLRVATGEYIALVNNDTRADPGWLENLAQPMRDDSKVGICASKLIIEGTDCIDSAGDGMTTAGVGFNRGH